MLHRKEPTSHVISLHALAIDVDLGIDMHRFPSLGVPTAAHMYSCLPRSTICRYIVPPSGTVSVKQRCCMSAKEQVRVVATRSCRSAQSNSRHSTNYCTFNNKESLKTTSCTSATHLILVVQQTSCSIS